MVTVKAGSESNFEPVAEGTHIARCIGVIDLGTQPGGKYPPAHKVMILYEVPAETYENDDGETVCRTIGLEETSSISEKANLRKKLESWRGEAFSKEELEGFDLDEVLNVPALITVIHKVSANKRRYGIIAGIILPPKGTDIPPRENELLNYDIGGEMPKGMPEWIANKINQAAELQEENQMPGPGSHGHQEEPPTDNDLPF
ncbi:hypothetical protein LCGC14_1092030 [marine sediment metagenome]|uniref:Uncharacterized protein n=1 Tax=marine sediment metagenome TaxID=412755 RepID=A0A0F9MGD8_9ZZZZ